MIIKFIRTWLKLNWFVIKNRTQLSTLLSVSYICDQTDAQIQTLAQLALLRNIKIDADLISFINRNYELPCPNFIKNSVLLRHGFKDGIWIETGTYLGDTTEVLSQSAPMVYSIEPSEALVEKARMRFAGAKNVHILHGLSEAELPKLLSQNALRNATVNFWLDGHYSAGITHQGPQETPIIEELQAIEQSLASLKQVAVFIDDIRCFTPNSPYPTLDYLVNWANQHHLLWCIEYDIFVAKSHA
jgi:hypothetical protein